jgi:ubiquinone/menaquinone biosynthesis C-methylase UbiE
VSSAVRNPLFARAYARMSERESEEQIEHRRETLAGLSGRVLELGAGNGRNFGFYPAEVAEVLAIEPEPFMRQRAVEAAADAAVPIRVIDATADELPLADSSVDAAVTSLVLCSVPDQSRAIGELHRVVRPRGELRFYEHVHADRQPLRAVLAALDRSTLWPRLAGGCHPARDTLGAISAGGFEVERSRRFAFAAGWGQPRIPHIIGVARRV